MNWRAHLTGQERETLRLADEAKAEWQRLNAARAGIVNRAIKRASYRKALNQDAKTTEGETK